MKRRRCCDFDVSHMVPPAPMVLNGCGYGTSGRGGNATVICGGAGLPRSRSHQPESVSPTGGWKIKVPLKPMNVGEGLPESNDSQSGAEREESQAALSVSVAPG